jgi:predicted nucleic acid-binding protein
LARLEHLVVPTVCLYEVFKVVLRESGEDKALQAAALMRQGQVAELTCEIALTAAKISHEQRLPMADSIILATAQVYEAVIWTQDAHFKDKPLVKYFAKL